MGTLSNQAPGIERALALRDRTLRYSTRLLYLGDDANGVALEVMAVELEDGSIYVIHAMPLRERYAAEYEEVKRWRP